MNKILIVFIIFIFQSLNTAVVIKKTNPLIVPFLQGIVEKPLIFNPPKIYKKKFNLSSGTFYALESHELPLLNLTVSFTGGYLLENKNTQGLFSLMTSSLIEAGSKKFQGPALQEQLDSKGIRFNIIAGEKKTAFSVSLLKDDLNLVLNIIEDLINHPIYSQSVFQKNKNRMLEQIKRRNDRTSNIARRKLREVLFQGSILGYSKQTSLVKKINLKDIIKIHQKLFSRFNTDVLIEGDFNSSNLYNKMNNFMKKLPVVKNTFKQKLSGQIVVSLKNNYFYNNSYSSKIKNKNIIPPKYKIYFVHAKVSQATILVGAFSLKHSSKDYYAFKVMNFILGGGSFNSHFFREIRSNRGLAYSAYAWLAAGKDYGLYRQFAQTKSASSVEVIDIMKNLTFNMTMKLDEEEISWARTSIVNKFIFLFANSYAYLNQQYQLDNEDMPPGYLQSYRENISKVSKKDIHKVIVNQLKRPFAVIVVGDQKTVLPLLKSSGEVNILKVE